MKFHISLILLFISISVLGQTVNFSLDGSGQYISPENFQSEEREVTSTTTTFVDSLRVLTTYKRKYTTIQEYNPKVGINVTGNIHIKITDRLNLNTGLGLNYLLFDSHINSIFDFETQEIISIDTIIISEDSETPGASGIPGAFGGSQCDVFTGTIDFRDVKDGQSNHILSLKIPLEVEYILLEDKFFVSAGGYLQTPLFTSVVWENITTTEIEEINGETVCEYEKVINKNKTGSTFSDLQVGVGGSFTYMFSNKLGIKFGVAKDLNSIFNKPESSLYLSTNAFKPLKVSLGLRYRFGGAYIKAQDQMEKM